MKKHDIAEARSERHHALDSQPPAARRPVEPVRSIEQDHPWLWGVYAAAFVLTIVVCGIATDWKLV